MSRIAFSWTLPLFAIGGFFGAGFGIGCMVGRLTAPPTLSTMEAIIDRRGMRWSKQDMRRYCSDVGYMHPPFPSRFVDAEVLPARDGADVGTLVCYWSIER